MQYEVRVERDRYLEILAFTTYAYLSGKITAYSGILGGQRSLGEYIENFIYGKVAEEAFKKFLHSNFGIESLTDLDIADFILGYYLPDIIAVKLNDEYVATKFWIEVKEVRREQKWFLIPESGVTNRPYDVYVAVWVGLPDEHIAWLIKNVDEARSRMSKEWLKKMAEIEEMVSNINCRIVGYALYPDVERVLKAKNGDALAEKELDKKYGEEGWYYFDGRTALFNPDDRTWRGAVVGRNIGFFSSRLEKASKWDDEFLKYLYENERIVPLISKFYTYQDRKGRTRSRTRTIKPDLCKKFGAKTEDYREIFQMCMEHQLECIKGKYGSIVRKTSWFKQTID